MNPLNKKERYVAFLRGINVGGHKKVPMAELREAMKGLNFEEVLTVLNSGNIIFDADIESTEEYEKQIAEHLFKTFGFRVPTIIRKYEEINGLLTRNPFKNVSLNKNLRLYISFLKTDHENELQLPWESEDKAFRIIEKVNNNIFSTLDLSLSGTPKGMDSLEKQFGNDITTRNWNTILKISKKLEGSHSNTYE